MTYTNKSTGLCTFCMLKLMGYLEIPEGEFEAFKKYVWHSLTCDSDFKDMYEDWRSDMKESGQWEDENKPDKVS